MGTKGVLIQRYVIPKWIKFVGGSMPSTPLYLHPTSIEETQLVFQVPHTMLQSIHSMFKKLNMLNETVRVSWHASIARNCSGRRFRQTAIPRKKIKVE